MLCEIAVTKEEYDRCYEFAVKSAKTQREYRSGGSQYRSVERIQSDTLRGKIAEIVVKKFFESASLNSGEIKLDFNIYPRGKWDEQDFIINNNKISVKSAKWFSKWLLLELKDIKRGELSDYYIFVTITRDFRAGNIIGFASKEEILNDPKTIKLKKGENIPGTNTCLDADNYARHSRYLHNSQEDWKQIVE